MDAALRKEIRSMIQGLPGEELHAIKRFIEFVASRAEHPAVAALRRARNRRPEALSEEDAQRLRVADEQWARGEALSDKEAQDLFDRWAREERTAQP